MLFDVALILVALVVLSYAADAFVVGAARLSLTFGLPPLLVGAVVVGFGTGMPELLVSTVASARGSLDIAAGNIVGSNMANLTLVLGVAGLIARPETLARVVRREAPLSLATVALFGFLLQGGLTRVEGVVLVAAVVGALAVMLRAGDPAEPSTEEEEEAEAELLDELEEFVEVEEEPDPEPGRAVSRADVVRTVLGLLGTVASAQLLVVGAQGVAGRLGLAGGFVGLTLVAIGTSLPELVTAVQAARRNETALLAGNVLGSNIFNSTVVAGVAALAGPAVISERSLTVVAAGSMVAIAGLAWVFLGLGGRLRRWEAGVLLAVYAATIPLTA